MRISEKQIQEWTENPVTIELHKLLANELQEIVLTPMTGCLIYGDPQKTHENLVELEARENAFAILQLALEGDWGYFEEDSDEKP